MEHESSLSCKHPWGEFLKARVNVMILFRQQGRTDALIADTLSMTESQVQSILNNMEIYEPDFSSWIKLKDEKPVE